ncbi:protein of unknown function [Taphrina deformans PYCC 5710]|uniref:Uncharacterized protein n=1 Tax=Taphrina deformans (strain PYCC 5710 / ATCC 11124 / CBS 356.35 / IMI 108563 / JCM 9778 / NBRC 8474) TaxID=1097556 RepID=R4XB61_TAPDE|nr:protein of unknown function [Taphrina deformans PYCC 5710]|eukprot:CCG83063.1 protein of unknown function [Taphrina deformans PYCC 5710]
MGKDITKTILIQLLRVKDDKRVELKRILRNILTSPCEDYTIPDSYDRHEGYPHVTGSEQSTFNADTFATSICQKRQLINLIHAVTQVPRLNVIPKEEFISTLANILAPLSLWTTLDLMSYGSSKKSTMSTSLLLALCNGLLFRLAAYPERSSKGADRLVDWPKVQGWCLATSRSRDAIEATKVEFFKCTILWSFLGQAEHNVPQEAIVNATQSLSRGLDSVEKSVEDDPPNYPENREMGKQLLPTNEELRRDISLLKLHLQGSHHILQGSAMRVRR